MNKLEQAARQALEALGTLDCGDSYKTHNAATALREALDHSGEANEMVVGWDRVKPEAIASDPLYQQGFVDGVEEGRNQVAEQAEQEPVKRFTSNDVKVAFENGYAAGVSVAQVAKEAEQEPVAWMYEYATDRGDAVNEIRWYPNLSFIKPSWLARNVRPLYAAPVSTKDLTDDEIRGLFKVAYPKSFVLDCDISLARAVIAADREKNK